MARLLGLETEYGLAIEGADPGQMVSESRAVVCSYAGPFASPWDYTRENPRRDMRGYVVSELSRNPEDARYDADGPQYSTIADEHADRVLPNGGRLYNDHGEISGYYTQDELRDLVAYDRAGAEIVLDCARRRSADLGRRVGILRNNTDFHGASYGAHECYLTARSTPVDVLISALGSFLATRQILAGAGKAAYENATGSKPGYQLSQRADFIAVEASVDTLFRRPLVNTRDEPHAVADAYRRLHVICGDANMSEWATALKVGSMALVLDALEAGLTMPAPFRDPVKAVLEISRDLTFSRRFERKDAAPPCTAIEMQRAYLDVAARVESDLAERDWVLEEWARALDDLKNDPESMADRADWCAKKALLETLMSEDGLDWSAPVLRSLDLAYHDLDPDIGLSKALEQQGLLQRIVTDEDVAAAKIAPPRNTRAFIRGHFASRHSEAVRSVGWAGLTFASENDVYEFDMEPLVDGVVAGLNERLDTCMDLARTMEVLRLYRGGDRAVAAGRSQP